MKPLKQILNEAMWSVRYWVSNVTLPADVFVLKGRDEYCMMPNNRYCSLANGWYIYVKGKGVVCPKDKNPLMWSTKQVTRDYAHDIMTQTDNIWTPKGIYYAPIGRLESIDHKLKFVPCEPKLK